MSEAQDDDSSYEPCSDPLVVFLYFLLRDELPAGAVLRAVAEARRHPKAWFSNAELAALARATAARLQAAEQGVTT